MQPMGQVFADLVTPLRRPYVNLVVARVQMQPVSAGTVSLDTAQPVIVRATIQNRGNTATTQSFRVVIEDQDGALVHVETVNGMPVRYGGNAVIQTAWQKPAGTDWRLTVRIDTEEAVNESDEDDNESELVPAADLDVTSLTVRGLNGWGAGQPNGASLDVVAQVENRNGMYLAGATARFWDGSQLLDQRALPDLAPGAQTEVIFAWPNAVSGLHTLAVDAVLPPGVSDPVAENNRIGRDILLAGQRSYLPTINGPQFQTGQTTGVTCSNALANPSFESGDLSGWTATPLAGLMNSACFDGTYCLWLGRGMNIEDDVYQTVSVKPWVSSLHLTFAWAVVTTETVAEQRDTLAVEVRSATGQLLRTVQALDNRDAHPYWYTSDLSLNEFAGQTIQLHFRGRNDGANPTSFFVDKVNLEVCEKR
jgi:subtilase family serine protease